MKKIYLILISLIFAIAAPASEPLTASKVFAEAPLEVLDMLRPSARLDMLDYYSQADSIVSVADALGGQSRIVTLTPDYMKVAVTPVSTLEIKILPYKKNFIAMTLYTVGGDSIAKDSFVRFFDRDLNPMPVGKLIKLPAPKDFFRLKGSDVTEANLSEWLPFQTLEYSTGPGDAPLTLTLTTLATLPMEKRDRLRPLLVPSLTLRWTGSSFR